MIDFKMPYPTMWLDSLLRVTQISAEKRVELADAYAGHNRCYHGSYHIAFLWHCHRTLADECDFTNADSLRIANAIACHDVIYDPESKTNEKDSAKWWKAATFDPKPIDFPPLYESRLWVSNAIEATENHFADHPDDMLLHWFLGLDLISLAAPWDTFVMNGHMIRAEYSHLSDNQWKASRAAFFAKINGKAIFRHPLLQRRFEAQAKSNIERILNEST